MCAMNCPSRTSTRRLENDGEVNAIKLKKGEPVHPNGNRKIVIVLFVIVFALLLGTAGACVAFALQITTLKSEIALLQMAFSSQDTFTDTLEEVVQQLITSNNMLYQQLSQQNASLNSVYQQLNEQLNTSVDMLYIYTSNWVNKMLQLTLYISS